MKVGPIQGFLNVEVTKPRNCHRLGSLSNIFTMQSPTIFLTQVQLFDPVGIIFEDYLCWYLDLTQAYGSLKNFLDKKGLFIGVCFSLPTGLKVMLYPHGVLHEKDKKYLYLGLQQILSSLIALSVVSRRLTRGWYVCTHSVFHCKSREDLSYVILRASKLANQLPFVAFVLL